MMGLIFCEALVITLLSLRKKDYENCLKLRGEAYAKDRRKILHTLGPALLILTGFAWLAETLFG